MMEIVATNVVASQPPNADRLHRQPLVPKMVHFNNFPLSTQNYCLKCRNKYELLLYAKNPIW